VNELPEKRVGPVNRVQVLPRLSLNPLMLTGSPFQVGWLDTNATSVEAPVELKAVDVCAVNGVPLM
jgi:hypothetical protein